MDASFIPVEIVPSKTPFGLDQLRRSYKTALDAAAAIAAAPVVGTADETFPNMFLMPISTPESAESATRIDLLYMGCLSGDEGDPVLPDQKNDTDDAVLSASSSRASTGAIATSPLTLQYYGPASVLTYFSFGGIGTLDAPSPVADPRPITVTFGDTTSAISPPVQNTINAFFSLQEISTLSTTEIVPGKYWQNTARRTKIYSPYIFQPPTPGAYISLYSPGTGYLVGDTLSFSVGGESATVVVTQVLVAWGTAAGVYAWTVSSNTFTAAHSMLFATGGTGTGAGFNVFIIT